MQLLANKYPSIIVAIEISIIDGGKFMTVGNIIGNKDFKFFLNNVTEPAVALFCQVSSAMLKSRFFVAYLVSLA